LFVLAYNLGNFLRRFALPGDVSQPLFIFVDTLLAKPENAGQH